MITYIGLMVAATGEVVCLYVFGRMFRKSEDGSSEVLEGIIGLVALGGAVAIAFLAWSMLQASAEMATSLQQIGS